MIAFLSTNWVWMVLIGGMLFMHLGHRGHGSHGGGCGGGAHTSHTDAGPPMTGGHSHHVGPVGPADQVKEDDHKSWTV